MHLGHKKARNGLIFNFVRRINLVFKGEVVWTRPANYRLHKQNCCRQSRKVTNNKHPHRPTPRCMVLHVSTNKLESYVRLSRHTLCHAVTSHFVSRCHVTLCVTLSRHTLCHAVISHFVSRCHVTLCVTLSRHTLCHAVTSHFVSCCHVPLSPNVTNTKQLGHIFAGAIFSSKSLRSPC